MISIAIKGKCDNTGVPIADACQMAFGFNLMPKRNAESSSNENGETKPCAWLDTHYQQSVKLCPYANPDRLSTWLKIDKGRHLKGDNRLCGSPLDFHAWMMAMEALKRGKTEGDMCELIKNVLQNAAGSIQQAIPQDGIQDAVLAEMAKKVVEGNNSNNGHMNKNSKNWHMNKVAKGMKGLQGIGPNHTNWQQESTLNWQNQMMMGGFNEMMIGDSGHQQGNKMKTQHWDPTYMNPM